MNALKSFLLFFFGDNVKTRFKRVIYLLLITGAVVFMLLNIKSCGYKDGHFYFEIGPAADITINKEIK